MFTSIDQLDRIFKRYDDGTTASLIDCNRALLSKLVLAATSTNYWLSRHAMNILVLGVDTIQPEEDPQDIHYLELLTINDWALLLDGQYCKHFPTQYIDYVHGWPLELLALTEEALPQLVVFLSSWVNHKSAIMAVAKLYMKQIALVVPEFDLSIWQYLVQLPDGKQLVADSLSKYARVDQKRINAYLQTYGYNTNIIRRPLSNISKH
jgi:hypothetical protein